MLTYVFTAIISIFFSVFSIIPLDDNNVKINRVAILLSFLPLWIVSGIRYDVGQDYFYTYVPIFNSIRDTGTYPSVEWGYIFLNKLTLLFTDQYVGIFLVTSFLIVFFVYLAIYQQSNIPWLSVFVFINSTFYFISMNLVRQSIAIAMFLYSIKYIEERNFKKYAIIILLGSLIHTSELIFLPIYFIANRRINFKKFIVFYAGMEFLFPLFKGFIYSFISNTRYAYYIGSIYDDGKSSAVLSPLISLFTVLIGYYYLNKGDNTKDKYYNIYLNIQVIATLISTTLGVIPLALRLFIDFQYISILFIPRIISREKNKFVRFILLMMILAFYVLYFYYSIGIKGGSKNLPYQTIFDL